VESIPWKWLLALAVTWIAYRSIMTKAYGLRDHLEELLKTYLKKAREEQIQKRRIRRIQEKVRNLKLAARENAALELAKAREEKLAGQVQTETSPRKAA
jgi:sensor histidine kinase YesM